jgi:DsbC/DsbD-like thiol-disulfide interchange protein
MFQETNESRSPSHGMKRVALLVRQSLMMRLCTSTLGSCRVLALGAAALLSCAAGARAAGTPIPHGTLELVAENQWIAPGHAINLGLHFQLEKGWHIYWVNSGEPPRVKWQLPAGVAAGEMGWPTPRRLGTASIVDFGYEEDVMLIVPLHAEAGLAAQGPAQGTAQIGAEVKVLVCREMCIPGKAQLSLTLPVKSQPPAPDAQTAELFAAARKALPQRAPGSWRISVTDARDSFALTAKLGQHIVQASFFPLEESQIKDAAPQQFAAVPGGFHLTLQKSDQLLKPIARLKGVLVLPGDRGYIIDVPVSKAVAVWHNDGEALAAAVPQSGTAIGDGHANDGALKCAATKAEVLNL